MAKDLETNVRKLREEWKSSGGKPLSLDQRGIKAEIEKNAVKCSRGPSIIRALRYPEKMTKKEKDEVFDKAKEYLAEELHKLLQSKTISETEFDGWAKETASKIRDIYRSTPYEVKDFTYGNAQKLINMAIKYLLSSSSIDKNHPLFKVAHIPVDGIIQSKLGVKIDTTNHSWSQCDDWKVFKEYQKVIRKLSKEKGYYSPLICEIDNW